MNRSHYETLGIKSSATEAEIKTAYRKLVLKYHPDASKSTKSAEMFILVTEAYHVVGDAERRKEYDRMLRLKEEMARGASTSNAATSQPPKQASSRPQESVRPKRIDLERLTKLVSVGKILEAETMARSILKQDPTQAVAYAALAEICRTRGEMRQACKLYAFAVQYAPENPVFLRKHEELLDSVQRTPSFGADGRINEQTWVAPFVGTILCIVATCYVALSPENPIFDKETVISSWTIGLMGSCFASGAIMAACLSLSDLVDRFEMTNSFGRISPLFTFMSLAIINIWVAGLIYFLVGGLQRAFNVTISRIFVALVAVTTIMTMGAAMSRHIDPYQVLAFGGSLVSLGALFGWSFADGFREAK